MNEPFIHVPKGNPPGRSETFLTQIARKPVGNAMANGETILSLNMGVMRLLSLNMAVYRLICGK
jgi:hypothetical protein